MTPSERDALLRRDLHFHKSLQVELGRLKAGDDVALEVGSETAERPLSSRDIRQGRDERPRLAGRGPSACWPVASKS